MERNAPVEGGGNRCDTLCCILNCSLELLCLLLILGTFFLPAFSVHANAVDSFSIDRNEIYTQSGKTINLHYTGASTGADYYICAIIQKDGNELHHMKLKSVGNITSGNVNMTIPKDIQSGDYTLIIYNGECSTNHTGCTSAAISLKIAADPGTRLNTNYNKALGVCTIKDPVYDSANGNNTPHPSEYNRVYFGWIPEETTGTIIDTKNPYGDGDSNVKNMPIYWRVLNTTANDTSSTPALFMLTEYTLPGIVYWDRQSVQKWSYMDGSTNKTDSAIRKFLQGTSCKATYTGSSYSADVGFYDQCFDKPEQEAIMYTTNGERLNYCNSGQAADCSADGADRPYSYTTPGKKSGDTTNVGSSSKFCGCGLNKEKIFLLSAKEVLDTKYGFENKYDYLSSSNYYTSCDTNRAVRTLSTASGSNTSGHWWLRSAYSLDSNRVACVISSGFCSYGSIDSTGVYVRCALNIPLSSILFTSDASTECASPSSTFTAIPTSLTRTKFQYGTTSETTAQPAIITDADGNSCGEVGAKLTIVDNITNRRLFWIPQGKYTWDKTQSGGTITLPYRRAATGKGEYISAIIKDPKDEQHYYARLKAVRNSADSNGTVTMTIPSEILTTSANVPIREYTLIMMSEKDNGLYRTNYAKNYNLRLTIDGSNITITGNDAVGACTIQNPEYDPAGSTYDRVYFGRTPTTANGKSVKPYALAEPTTQSMYIFHNQPIYWRVLNTTANDTSGIPALFMLTEYCITSNMSWDNKSSYYGQNWTNSDGSTDSAIKKFLLGDAGGNYNGTSYGSSVYEDCFNAKEQCALLSTYNKELHTDDQTNILYEIPSSVTSYAYGCALTGEKLFLLSAKEVTNKEYGFNNSLDLTNILNDEWKGLPSDINRQALFHNSSNNFNYWWLRSGSSRNSLNIEVCLISHHGFLDCCTSSGEMFYSGVRFALNIPLSKILFTSDSNNTTFTPSSNFLPIVSSTSPAHLTRTTITSQSSVLTISPTSTETVTLSGQILYPVNNTMSPTPTNLTIPYGAGSKLTIVDDTRPFAVTQNIVRCDKGASISVQYTGAKTNENTTNNMGYISAIIKDTYGNPLYHTRIKAVGENSNGSVNMIIPNDIDYGEYTLVIYNEVERGAKNTNYAGYDTVMLVVINDNSSPNVSNVYRNANATNFKLTANDNSDLYQVIDIGGNKLRDLAHPNVTTNIQLNGHQSTLVLEDLAGNKTRISTNDILLDDEPPSVNIAYANGTYTLTVSDSESGVWKITSQDGATIYCDYSISNVT